MASERIKLFLVMAFLVGVGFCQDNATTPIVAGVTPTVPGVTPTVPGVTPTVPGVTPTVAAVTPTTAATTSAFTSSPAPVATPTAATVPATMATSAPTTPTESVFQNIHSLVTAVPWGFLQAFKYGVKTVDSVFKAIVAHKKL